VFAILGLRSLYFVLAGAIEYFRYLKVGLSVVLVFVGVKMLLDPHDAPAPRWWQLEIPTGVSLLVVAGILLTAILLSVQATRREKLAAARAASKSPAPDAAPPASSPPPQRED
jgi:tellurite resistance protein TerC